MPSEPVPHPLQAGRGDYHRTRQFGLKNPKSPRAGRRSAHEGLGNFLAKNVFDGIDHHAGAGSNHQNVARNSDIAIIGRRRRQADQQVAG